MSIATRCPQCGQELLTQPVAREAPRETGRLGGLLVVAVMLLAGAGLFVLVERSRSGARDQEARETVVAAAPAEAPVALDTGSAAASPAMPDSAPSAEAVPRYARTWTKVHERRSARADVVAVLLPGDTVLADSLRGDWWRVALEGRVLGYVYDRTLLNGEADSGSP